MTFLHIEIQDAEAQDGLCYCFKREFAIKSRGERWKNDLGKVSVEGNRFGCLMKLGKFDLLYMCVGLGQVE